MRRTSISLAIVALLLCGRTMAQSWPQGESAAEGIPTPLPAANPPAAQTAIDPNAADMDTTTDSAYSYDTNVAADPQMPVDASLLQPVPETNGSPDGGQWQELPPMGNSRSVGPCCALCGAGKCCPKQWYVDQRIRMMTHPRPRDIVFSSWHTTETYQTTSGDVTLDVYTPAISTRTTPFNLAASYEITAGRYLGLDTKNRNHFLEFTFYGTDRWSSGVSVISSQDEGNTFDDGNAVGIFGNLNGGRSNVAGFNRADSQWAQYSASLNNFEVNLRLVPRSRADRLVLHKNGRWRRECQPGVVCSWLAGLRLFTLDEDFDFHSSSTIEYYTTDDLETPYDTNTATGVYRTKTNNGLLGLQAGPEWIFRQCRMELSLGARAAAYINFAEQQSWINVTGAEGDEFSDKQDIDVYKSMSRNGAATSIQLDFSASYKVRPNMILKASYELLYMAGLVLAPEQVNMSLDESITINDGGALLFQSGTLGFEYNW